MIQSRWKGSEKLILFYLLDMVLPILCLKLTLPANILHEKAYSTNSGGPLLESDVSGLSFDSFTHQLHDPEQGN